MFGMDEDLEPSEMESSSETPYMRRSRAVAVRRSWIPQGIRRFAWWAAIILFILLPAGFFVYSLGVYIRTSPRFKLDSPKDVTVEGNHYVSQDAILASLRVFDSAVDRGSNIFGISLRETERQVESIPWVQTATVVRSYPHYLTVYVTERRPIAFVDVNNQIKMVDQDGILLDPPEKSHFDFPIVKGLDFRKDPSGRKERLKRYREFKREIGGRITGSGWIVSEVDLSDASNLKALLVQGKQTLLVYFGHEDFLGRFKNFLTILPRLRKTNARIDSVDLRYRNQVVVNPVEENSMGVRTGASKTTKKAKGN